MHHCERLGLCGQFLSAGVNYCSVCDNSVVPFVKSLPLCAAFI